MSYVILGSRVPFNTLTGVIDANTVYSVTEDYARYFKKLKMLMHFILILRGY